MIFEGIREEKDEEDEMERMRCRESTEQKIRDLPRQMNLISGRVYYLVENCRKEAARSKKIT